MLTLMIDTSKRTHERYWEIDAIRGFLVIGMVFFHTIFLLGIFNIISIDFWQNVICRNLVGNIRFELIHLGTSLFVMVSGFSLILRHRRMDGMPHKLYCLAIVKRALIVFLIGVAFAIVSDILIYFFIGGEFMFFNFLMMMGLSMILCIPFVGLKKWSFIPAIILIVSGFFLSTISGPIGLMPFGVLPEGFLPRDYFPLLPWAGIMLLGSALGSVLYPDGHRRFKVKDKPKKVGKFLSILGKQSLMVYVFHIPAIALVILIVIGISYLIGCPIGSIGSFGL